MVELVRIFSIGFLMLVFPILGISSSEMHVVEIPKIIWQTYKVKNLPFDAKKAQNTWILRNPDYTHVLWDDDDIEKYIKEEWDKDTYTFFKMLPLGVMKADLWRYLILTTEGGIYSDIDSICCRPLKSWARSFLVPGEDVLLVGLENDCHFCQWTIVSTPHHPAMKFVSKHIVDMWKIRGINIKNPHFVHATTGPAIWTEALVLYLGETPGLSPGEIYKKYRQDSAYKQKINKLGVFIMPVEFYSGYASKNLYGSQQFGDGYVKWTDEANRILELGSK